MRFGCLLLAILLLALGIPCSAQLATIMGILGGISFAADDMLIPQEKHGIISEAETQVKPLVSK